MIDAVLAAPYDLGARIEYATQLDTPLGEYIAMATELVTLEPPSYFEVANRAEALYRKHRATWKPTWGMPDAKVNLFAGMPARVEIDGRKKPDLAKVGKVIAGQPVTTFDGRELGVAQLKKIVTLLGRVRELKLQSDQRMGLIDKLGKQTFPHLESLSLDRIELGDDEVIDVLDRMPNVTRISGLFRPTVPKWSRAARLRHVGGTSVWTRTLHQLAATSVAAANLVVDEGGDFPDVRALRVGVTSASKWLTLFPNLTSLGFEMYDDDHEVLKASAVWDRLERLDLETRDPELVAWFVKTILPRCKALRSLSIIAVPKLRAVLERMPRLEQLRVTIDDPAIEVTDLLPPTVRTLQVGNEVGSLVALAKRGLPLEYLAVSTGSIDLESIRALVRVPTLKKIETAARLPKLDGVDGNGRRLGPPVNLMGPQREPVWGYEP